MSDTVYAKNEISLGDPRTGAIYKIPKGQAWDANDPIVTGHPDEFDTTPPEVRTSGGWVRRSARGVEDATAKPGKKRNR